MTDTTKTPGETPEGGAKPGTKAAGGAEAKAEVYDLEPHVPAPPTARVAKLEAPGLTDDFEEDADFDHDPVMPTAAVPKAPAAPVDTFVKAGWGSAQVVGTLGIAAALGATVLAAWLGDGPWYKAVVLSLYHIGLQTMAGVCRSIAPRCVRCSSVWAHTIRAEKPRSFSRIPLPIFLLRWCCLTGALRGWFRNRCRRRTRGCVSIGLIRCRTLARWVSR